MDDNESMLVIPPIEPGSLQLPTEVDTDLHGVALEIDALVGGPDSASATLDAKLASHRDAGQMKLLSFHKRHAMHLDRLRWPSSLFIPKGANYADYWITPAPDTQRYASEWTTPGTGNAASSQNGTLYTFGRLPTQTPSVSQNSESGIGVIFNPSMTLGVVELQPRVDCTTTLRVALEFFPQLAAGYVEVRASLLLAAWQLTAAGYDLVGSKGFAVATTGKKEQTHGPVLLHFQHAFDGTNLSHPFLVEKGRTYVLGVVARISIASTLTTNDGRPLGPIANNALRVWGAINCLVPQIEVVTKQIHIP